MRRPLTNEELKGMARHVQYEIDEFRKAIEDLPNLVGHYRDWNRSLESALLHFRILREFYFNEGNRPDDVFAKDYVEGWCPGRDPIFDVTKEDLDKRLAHLTRARLTDKKWSELNQICSAIEGLISAFSGALSPERLSWFPRLLTSKVPMLAVTDASTLTVERFQSLGDDLNKSG